MHGVELKIKEEYKGQGVLKIVIYYSLVIISSSVQFVDSLSSGSNIVFRISMYSVSLNDNR